MSKKIFILFILILIAVKTINAEEVPSETIDFLGSVIVTATKTEQSQATVGSSSTVITAKDLERIGSNTVRDVLEHVPSISVAQSGSFGGTTAVYLRGSNIGHTLVLIDGIEVRDPMQMYGGFFDFAHLTTDNIERIEIIRGSQSTLYGSDAIGGVINIITKKGRGKPKWEISSEGGSHNTFREYTAVSGGAKDLDYSFSISRLDSDGISKASDGSEKDGYQNTTVSSRIGHKISDDSEIDIILHYTAAETDLDDAAYEDDPNRSSWWRDFAGKFSFDQKINSRWDHKLSFSYNDVRRKERDEKDSIDTTEDNQSWFKADTKKFEWQHNFSPVSWDTLTSGFEYEEERGSSYNRAGTTITKFNRKTVDNTGCYFQNQLKFWENLFVTGGLRLDDHQIFGTETTCKISTAYIIPEKDTRLKANWGTGFKAPSLYQLYHPTYGDINLNPEESKNYDFGIEQSFLDNGLSLGLTYFYNNFENLIEYNTSTSKYENVGKAKTKGLETELTFKPIKSLKIGANYTYTKTENKNTGKRLNRRSQNQIGLDINWLFFEKFNLNLNTKYIGHNWDDAANTRKVKPYAKVDLSVYYDLTKDFQIFARIGNILDRKYQENRGYATAGRSFYTGGKATF